MNNIIKYRPPTKFAGIRTCKSFITNDGHLIEKRWEPSKDKPTLAEVFDKCEGRERARSSLMRYILR